MITAQPNIYFGSTTARNHTLLKPIISSTTLRNLLPSNAGNGTNTFGSKDAIVFGRSLGQAMRTEQCNKSGKLTPQMLP